MMNERFFWGLIKQYKMQILALQIYRYFGSGDTSKICSKF